MQIGDMMWTIDTLPLDIASSLVEIMYHGLVRSSRWSLIPQQRLNIEY